MLDDIRERFAGHDTRDLCRVLALDGHRRTIEVEAGIQWPRLLKALQAGSITFAQKQTGADDLSIGGAVSANVHGRGLTMRPFVADVESLVLVGADGVPVRCSRDERPDLFRLVIGGYGLFGVVYSVTLRLVPRCTLERVVELQTVTGSWMPSTSESIRGSSTATSSLRSTRPPTTSSATASSRATGPCAIGLCPSRSARSPRTTGARCSGSRTQTSRVRSTSTRSTI